MNVIHSEAQHAGPVRHPGTLKWVLIAFFSLFALVAFVIHSQAAEAKERADSRLRFETASAHIPEMLARVTYRQPANEDLQPAVVWSGAKSTILHTDYQLDTHHFSPDTHTWFVFARTPSGKFFDTEIHLDDDDTCSPAKVVECSHDVSFHPIADRDVKGWVYGLKDAKLYRQLFNEEMPPLEVPA